jgi:hypothetical protein
LFEVPTLGRQTELAAREPNMWLGDSVAMVPGNFGTQLAVAIFGWTIQRPAASGTMKGSELKTGLSKLHRKQRLGRYLGGILNLRVTVTIGSALAKGERAFVSDFKPAKPIIVHQQSDRGRMVVR